MLQQSAKPLAADDLAAGFGNGRDLGRRDISDPLVRSLFMIMAQELAADAVQMRLAHHNKMVLGSSCP